MGEIADVTIDGGMEEWWAHVEGNCFEDCGYCNQEELYQRNQKKDWKK